jgi:LDH2 family malate/lactate/ureidoglycolate dehydrogenase
VQQLKREGKEVPPGCAIDAQGNPTTDPSKVAAILPMAQHKGFGLALVIELLSALTGGSTPTIRGLFNQTHQPDEKLGTTAYFQVIHPEALNCGNFACKRSQAENVKAVLENIRCKGNENTIFPGEFEHRAAVASEKNGGLLFSEAEMKALAEIAEEAGVKFDPSSARKVEV